jgi:hypothetical protein
VLEAESKQQCESVRTELRESAAEALENAGMGTVANAVRQDWLCSRQQQEQIVVALIVVRTAEELIEEILIREKQHETLRGERRQGQYRPSPRGNSVGGRMGEQRD